MKIIYTILIILISLTNSFAGWFKCYNYEGELGDFKIHMYIQLFEKNSPSKDSIIISGVYKYDKFNTPIILEGVLLNNEILKLTEITDNKIIANISILWGQDSLNGSWTSIKTGKKLDLKLKKTGSLIDMKKEYSFERTEILMKTSFNEMYLIGVYVKKEDYEKAEMIELRILDKKTNEIIQSIDFSENYWGVGNIQTEIFSNVGAINSQEGKPWRIVVHTDEGKMGDSMILEYCPCLNKFLIAI